jgi:DNA-binding transcriptional MerR regulator
MKEQRFMVGDVAERFGVSVRTLQYYDKIGLISPGGKSDGGRRLYSDKDIVKLFQVLSLKRLGFSLEEIKGHLSALDTPQAVIRAIEAQSEQVAKQIESLTEAQTLLGALKDEVDKMNEVDWRRYAAIIDLLRKQNDFYWAVKFFDDKVLKRAAENFTESSAKEFAALMEGIWDRANALIDENESAESGRAQTLAREWWDAITVFTGGDAGLLPELVKFAERSDSWGNARWKEKWAKSQDFLSRDLGLYLTNHQIEVKL